MPFYVFSVKLTLGDYMDYQFIGAQIKKFRKVKGMTQQELADQINKTKSSIQKYEKGIIEMPNSVLEQIAAALGCSIRDLTFSPMDVQYDLSRITALPNGDFIIMPERYDLSILDESIFIISYPDGSQIETTEDIFDEIVTRSSLFFEYQLDQLQKNQQK